MKLKNQKLSSVESHMLKGEEIVCDSHNGIITYLLCKKGGIVLYNQYNLQN